MGISAGKPVEVGKSLRELDLRESLSSIGKSRFNGYACVTLLGKAGLEEGLVVFDSGSLVLSSYEYFKYNRKYTGGEALKRFLNALRSPSGIVDIFSLSAQEVKLVRTLKEEWANQSTPTEKLNIPARFSEEFADSLIPRADREPEKADLMRKLGLSETKEVPYTKFSLMRRAKSETRQ
ncbi:DUF2226 domain-containing protein [Candidatus Micrarchaeota archaeon]|nr:DUF2226 domain-containing protein [Candidatus Micrarchaeota archaeon]